MKKLSIGFPGYVNTRLKVSSANSLPYGLLISHILEVMKVDLSPLAPKVISSTYDKIIFAMMGYTLVEGTWVKKDKASKTTPPTQ